MKREKDGKTERERDEKRQRRKERERERAMEEEWTLLAGPDAGWLLALTVGQDRPGQ